MAQRWEIHKELLSDLFLVEEMTLQETISWMEDNYNFYASKAQYERMFRKWGVRKHLDNPKDIWKFVSHRVEQRKRQGKQSEVYIGYQRIPISKVRKEISRYNLPTYGRAPTPKTPKAVRVCTPRQALFMSNATAHESHVTPLNEAVPIATAPSDTNGQRKGSNESLGLYGHHINNNDNGVAQLAGQITCLFWFEKTATLEAIEDSTVSSYSLVPDALLTTGFLKWVTMILSMTQVGDNVILLALLFIYRLKRFNPGTIGKKGSEFRVLTVALMIGKKYLDDNTCTNKTWAGGSGISAPEINRMEVEFLSKIKYHLFVSEENWKSWCSKLNRFADFCVKVSWSLPLAMSLVRVPVSLTASPPRLPHPNSYQTPSNHDISNTLPFTSVFSV